MQLIDIGANLTHESFDHDRDAVLQRAYDAGVVQMVVTGTSRTHSPRAVLLAQRHPRVLYATAGVHPHYAAEYTDECDAEMRILHTYKEVVAVGECGLDYFRDFLHAGLNTGRSNGNCSWPVRTGNHCFYINVKHITTLWR